jgi:hypothetical protein
MTAHRGTADAAARVRARAGAGRPALAVALAVAALAAGPLLALQDRLLLGSCTVPGHAGPLALRLALLQASPDCPGSLGLGPTTRGAVVLASVGLPVLLVHVALVALGGSLGALVARVARGVVGVLRSVLVPVAPRLRVGPAVRRLLAATGSRVGHGRAPVGVLPTRGPPVAA